MSNIDKINDQVLNQQRENIMAQIDTSFQSLVIHAPKAILPENVFVTYFLPFFSGTPLSQAMANRNVISEWIGIAGTAMAEVDIVDINGQVLFTVPALFDTDMIEIASRSAGQSMSDVIHEYNLRKTGIPQAATNYLHGALNTLGNNMIRDSNHGVTIAQRWTMILQRYNLSPAGEGIRNQASQVVNPGDDLDYS